MGDGDSRAGSATRTRRQLEIDVLLPAGMRAPGLARWLQLVAPRRARGTVTIAVVPDGRVRALNRVYRKMDVHTDVLSFPADASMQHERFLGDVIIAAGVARRQSAAAGHSLPTELRVLALHGLLHLLGYDHDHDDGQMARLERRLRRKGGLREGLIERVDEAVGRPARGRSARGVRRAAGAAGSVRQ